MKIVLISGKLQSGKNTAAEYIKTLLEDKGKSVKTDLFAKSVKDGCKEDFKKLAEVLNTFVDDILTSELFSSEICINILRKLRISDENWYENKTDITRVLLQIYGTDIFRKRVSIDYWVDDFIKRIANKKCDYLLVTDVRFLNEIEGIFKSGHEIITIRINRNIETKSEHISETALDNYLFWNHVIENNDTKDELFKQCKIIINQI